MSVKITSIPLPQTGPDATIAVLVAMKQAIEQLASAAVSTDELVRLGLVTSQMIVSKTGRVTK